MCMNYRNEREHDEKLIRLVKMLNEHEQLNLFTQAFDLPECGELERAAHRQPYDVELTFANYSVVIETKVDSDEGGRWSYPLIWQTTQIVQIAENLPYLHEEKHYRFITYGTSEFYTKHGHEDAENDHHIGPFDDHFVHIKLIQMIEFVELTNNIFTQCDAREEWLNLMQIWLNLMQIEQAKRNAAPDLLVEFSQFRNHYLAIHHIENDFPRNRFLFCAPELAFPVMGQLREQWNDNRKRKEHFGRLALYPVSRRSPPIHDSILGFWDLKVYLDEERERYCYFEINEDFNLNMKSAWDIDDQIGAIHNALNDQDDWPEYMNGVARNYHQAVHVVYEIDFAYLVNADNLALVLRNLILTMEHVRLNLERAGFVFQVE